MSDFKVSAALEGHSDDVRAVAFPSSKVVLSASRDATVRVWKQLSTPPPTYDYTISSHGTAFINSLAYYPPTTRYPVGLIFSAGQDAIIEARPPGKPAEDNAEALLLGHSHNVCAIDVCPDSGWIVSGSWDSTARIWRVGKWETEVVLEGHEGSVWAVLAYDNETIVTGCADQRIRVFHISGKPLRTIIGSGSTDVVRALCKVPKGHPSGADFASAGNDSIVRLFTINGTQVGELHGHESFIYSLASLPSGELVSSGEDRTVRVWKGNQCIQTITHPAISVWSVAACQENGDIVTGASDRITRVFSREKDRQAENSVIQKFEDSVKESSIPQQQVGNINKEQLPGPDFLKQKSGTKDGQVQMIREDDGGVTAHTWSSASQEWVAVGTVVDSAGSSGKKVEYLGQDYDYVFDVDIEDGKPPLKLPYNLSQNPYEAATKFIQDNELPMSYLDQVSTFITTNTQGATVGQPAEPQQQGGDAWGQEARYRPGDAPPPSQPPSSLPTSRPNVLPQTSYLSIKTANIKTIQKKIHELNQQLISAGSKDISLNPSEFETVTAVCAQLEQDSLKESPFLESGILFVFKVATSWPAANRLPGLDLFRLLAAATPLTAKLDYTGEDLIAAIASSGVFESPLNVNNAMLSIRMFANLFETEAGQTLAAKKFEQMVSLVRSVISSSDVTPNRNLTIAVATLFINFSVLLTSEERASDPESTEHALVLLDELSKILTKEKDSEAIYRGLVALGTLVKGLGQDVKSAAKEIFEIERVLNQILEAGFAREPRVKGVVGEIRTAVGE